MKTMPWGIVAPTSWVARALEMAEPRGFIKAVVEAQTGQILGAAVLAVEGGEIRSEFAPQGGDIVALEHWCSSGFANTDLDLQLKKHGIHQLIVIGLIAHTCVEATVRYAAELGYEVTVVKDATASYSDEQMHGGVS